MLRRDTVRTHKCEELKMDHPPDIASSDVAASAFATASSEVSSEEEIKAALSSDILLRRGTVEFCQNLDALVEIKQRVEGVFREIIQKKTVLDYENIKPPLDLVQDCVPEGATLKKQLDALFARAPDAKTVFDAFCRRLASDISLDPDQVMLQVRADDENEDDKMWLVYTEVELKKRVRAEEKARNEYASDGRRLVDIVRGSIVVDTEDDLEAVVKRLLENHVETEHDGVRVVRFKNRFKHPMPDGGRDMNFNIVVTLDDGTRFVCELQVHLKQILDFNLAKHVAYEFFRAYFKGGGTESQRGEILERIAKNRDDTSDMTRLLKEALDGTDEDEL